MHSRLFLAVLPAFLCAVLPTLAAPIQSFDSLSIEARSLDLSSEAAQLVSRDVAEGSLFEREYPSDALLSRDIDGALFPRVRERTAHDLASEARKASVQAHVAHQQAYNAERKTELQHQAASLPEYVDHTLVLLCMILIGDTATTATESRANRNTPQSRRRRVHSTSLAATARKAATRAIACPSSRRHPDTTSPRAST
jgi:hypothetical protein